MGTDSSGNEERIREVVRTVIENAYLRASIHGTGRQVRDLSASERTTLLEIGEYPVAVDVDFLLTAFRHFATAPEPPHEELVPVEFDSGEQGEREK